MKIYLHETMTLAPHTIDAISDKISEIAGRLKTEKKDAVQFRLIAEDVLISYMHEFGENTPCTVKLYRSLTKYYLSVSVAGADYNPLVKPGDGHEYTHLLWENAAITASHQYTGDGINQIRLPLPRKKPSGELLSVSAIGAAVLFCFFLSLFPENVGTVIADDILSPIGKAYLSLVSIGGISMIFLSLISAIAGMSSIRELKSTGNVVIRHMMIKNAAFACFFAILVPFIFPIVSGGDTSVSGAGKQLLDIVIGIIPENLIDPFRDQNALQVSFLALLLGVFLLINKKRAGTVIRFFDELNRVVLAVIRFICSFMPFYIFISFSELLLSNHVADLKKCSLIPLTVLLFACIVIAVTKLVSKWQYNVPLPVNVKNSVSIALTGFLTCSSTACLEANRGLALDAYHVDEDHLQFTLIMQHLLNKVDVIISFLCFTFGLCSVFGVEYSLPGYVVMAFTVILLGMAVPPVPGSSIAVLTPLLLASSLPDEAVAIFTAIFVFTNMILTGTKVFCVGDDLIVLDKKIAQQTVHAK